MVPSQMDSVQATKKRYKTDNAAIDIKNNLAEGTVRVFRFIASSTPIRKHYSFGSHQFDAQNISHSSVKLAEHLCIVSLVEVEELNNAQPKQRGRHYDLPVLHH